MKNNYTGESNTYGYDDHDRSTRDVVAGGTNPRTYTFGYDAASNRLSAVVTGTSPVNQTPSYNSGNQISSTGYSYDGAGNRTTGAAVTATYDIAGQLTSTTRLTSPLAVVPGEAALHADLVMSSPSFRCR